MRPQPAPHAPAWRYRCAVTRSTWSFEPNITGVRWWIAVGSMSSILL
jgi:hypothetical protein